jgi:hypothetical protein
LAPLRLTPPDLVAIAVGLLVAAILGALLFSYVGWLGLGLLGLLGLVISVRTELFDDQAVGTSEHGSGTVGMMARQAKAATEDDSPEAKMRAAAGRSKRSGILYLINTASISLVAVGFGMFILHQL